jgi:galactosyl transferase GMA12/MNN10 family
VPTGRAPALSTRGARANGPAHRAAPGWSAKDPAARRTYRDAVRRALCTIGSGPHAQLLALSGPTFAAYADRHGYDLRLYAATPAPERPESWGRIRVFQELLDEYDEVLWIDADAAIVDDSRDIADELEPDDLMGMVAHVTPEGDDPIPNCGVWLLRRDPEVLEFLDVVWGSVRYIDHKWWENAAVLVALGYRLEPRVRRDRPTPLCLRTRLVPKAWNSVPIDPSAHPRIVHFPGMPLDERAAGLRDAVARPED